MRTPAEIPIAESYTFELRLDGIEKPVRASFNTVKSRQFEVGQRVRVRLVRRGLPPLWSRLFVTDMTPADSAGGGGGGARGRAPNGMSLGARPAQSTRTSA
jgi:hypothetical protein